jgi:hypothetical protein
MIFIYFELSSPILTSYLSKINRVWFQLSPGLGLQYGQFRFFLPTYIKNYNLKSMATIFSYLQRNSRFPETPILSEGCS